MIEVMIVEDDELISGLLRKMVERVDGFTVTYEAAMPSEAVQEFSKAPAKVVFVDIDLNGESGLDCARRLCDISPDVKIVFATAHSEYMADAFEIYAFDYIVKPFNMERISRTLNRIKDMERKVLGNPTASRQLMTDEKDGALEAKGMHDLSDREEMASGKKPSAALLNKLAVRGRDEIAFVDIRDVIFAERLNGSTRIVTAKEVYRMNISLTELMEKLPESEFMRSHRSYIINVPAISKLTQYGRWTYTVSFKDTTETALMTYENYEIIKELFFL